MTPNSRQGGGRKASPPKRRSRKPYAWERGLVASPIPPGERPKRCSACGTESLAKDLRYGYCASCWSPDTP